MFLKKKAHNLFGKSIKLALRNVRGSVTYVEPEKEEPIEEIHDVIEEIVKPKKVSKSKKNINEELVES